MKSILELVKDNTVSFDRIEFDQQTSAYWELEENPDLEFSEFFDNEIRFDGGHTIFLEEHHGYLVYKVDNTDFEFPVPFSDLRGGRFKAKDKAIYFMRWIRKEYQKNEQ